MNQNENYKQKYLAQSGVRILDLPLRRSQWTQPLCHGLYTFQSARLSQYNGNQLCHTPILYSVLVKVIPGEVGFRTDCFKI